MRSGCSVFLWILGTVGVMSGCGNRALQTGTGRPPHPDAAVDHDAADTDAGVPIDVPADAAAGDTVSSDHPHAEDGAVDLSPAPDHGLPEAGPDLPAEHAPADAGPDLPSEHAPADAGQDATADRRPLDAGQDLPSDRDPDSGPPCGSPWDVRHCGTCDHDCTALPHIAGIISPEWLSCDNGVCHATSCAVGYAHCATTTSTTTDIGCETSLWSDTQNCGGCGVTCGQLAGSPGVCHNGACVGECPVGFGDCTDDFGCETPLDTPYDCGACGRPACALANVVAPCRQPAAPSCDDGICAAGYGNCDRASPDCEAAYGSTAGTCIPNYGGTIWLPTGQEGVVAVAPDGTRFIGGQFTDPIDFDFTGGVDRRNPPSPPAPYHSPPAPYVTMARADGSYGWTRTFRTRPGPDGYTTGAAGVVALAALADGGVVVGGNFSGSIVLDPAGGAARSTPGQSMFIVQLDGSGAFVWGRVLEVPANGASVTMASLAVAADGSVFVGGGFWGQVDFDPSARTVNRVGNDYPGGTPFLLQLGKDGGFGWVDTWDEDSSNCVLYPGRIAVSAAGRVWVGGSYGGTCDFDPGTGTDLKTIGDGLGGEGYVLAVDATGRYVGTWTLGTWVTDLASDDQGAVYAVGNYNRIADFDPGPAEVLRTPVGAASSFAVKLTAAGAFQWVATQTDFTASAVALGPGGSVVVGGMLGGRAGEAGVIQLLPDQSPGWTVGFGGGEMAVNSLATTANGVFVAGWVYWDTDLDPGPGADTVPGGSPDGNPFVSAFTF